MNNDLVLVSVCYACDQLHPNHAPGCAGDHWLDEKSAEWVRRQRVDMDTFTAGLPDQSDSELDEMDRRSGKD